MAGDSSRQTQPLIEIANLVSHAGLPQPDEWADGRWRADRCA
ncbi:MAG: hypothetical protein ACRDYA_01275 [Egibacteraceae bacterium]